MTARYSLEDDVTFRLVGDSHVEATLLRRGGVVAVPFELWNLLPELRQPLSAGALHERCDTELSVDELSTLLEALVQSGVLTTRAPLVHAGIQSLLRADVFGDPRRVEDIHRHLRDGRMIVVRDAFPLELAERLYDALAGFTRWQPYEGSFPNFHFRHHNIFEACRYPEALKTCAAYFESRESRSFIEGLSDAPCGGNVEIGASWYQPGDYSLPHTDVDRRRTVAFIWHLTKHWNSRWGGQLVWCPSGARLQPAFNSLTLFRVTGTSLHFVAPVASDAQGKRLAVNGWWCRPDGDDTASVAPPTHEPVAPMAVYGLDVATLAPAGAVYIV